MVHGGQYKLPQTKINNQLYISEDEGGIDKAALYLEDIIYILYLINRDAVNHDSI